MGWGNSEIQNHPFSAWRIKFEQCCWFSMGTTKNGRVSLRIHGTGIFTYIWLIFMVNVGKYTSPMDPMGLQTWGKWFRTFLFLVSWFPIWRTYFFEVGWNHRVWKLFLSAEFNDFYCSLQQFKYMLQNGSNLAHFFRNGWFNQCGETLF